MNVPLHVFAGYGIELEYMIVDRQTLSVLPVADRLLHGASEVECGELGWSNELVLHVLELKNLRPNPSLDALAGAFQGEIRAINRALEPLGARLMPAAMHPWMNPLAETRLWPHDHAEIYWAYDRIFDCKRHGWANLQSMHLNLPFAGDEEFARLHAACRLVLPIIPALAASSPIAEGGGTGFQDFRMEVYRTHQARILSTIGPVIPETVTRRAEYEAQILAPMYREIAPLDPEGVLQHEWLNVRGAVPRFERSAIEIRVIDAQECVKASLAIAAAVSAVVESLYEGRWTPLSTQQAMPTDALADILLTCIRDAEQAAIRDTDYLRLLGFPGGACQAGELWRYLVETTLPERSGWQEPLRTILERGPLARRILRTVGPEPTRERLAAVYRELCDCLEEGRMFPAGD